VGVTTARLNVDPTDDCNILVHAGVHGGQWLVQTGAPASARSSSLPAGAAAADDFSITVSPASQTVNAGASTT